MVYIFGTWCDDTDSTKFVAFCREILDGLECYEFQGDNLVKIPNGDNVGMILRSFWDAGCEANLFDTYEEFEEIFNSLGSRSMQDFVDTAYDDV